MHRNKWSIAARWGAAFGVVAMVSACGAGGGGNGSSSSGTSQNGGFNPNLPEPSPNGLLQGNFTVSASPPLTDSTGQQVAYSAFVATDTTFIMVDSACNLFLGNLGQQGTSSTSQLTGTDYPPAYCNGVQKNAGILSTGFTATGTMPTTANSAYALQYQGPPANGTWTLTPQRDNTRSVDLTNLTGATFKSADGVLTLSFPSAATISGTMVIDGTSMPVTGSVAVERSSATSTVPLNQYTMMLLINNVKYQAYASLDDSGSSSMNALTLLGYAGRNVIQETLVKQ